MTIANMIAGTPALSHAGVAASVALALVAAVWDLKSGRIPNWLTGSGLLAGLLLHGVLGGPRALAWSAFAGVAAGALFLVLYIAGGMGAGDVKLMAAVGCLAGMAQLETILLSTALAGAVLGLAIAARRHKLRQTLANTVLLVGHHGERGLARHSEIHRGNAEALRMPFAVPIAAGCLAALALRSWKA